MVETAYRCSANLLGDRLHIMQDMHGQVGRSLVAELGAGHDCVPDKVDTNLVGRAEHYWRRHHIFLFSRACSLATELPDIHDVTLIPAAGMKYGRATGRKVGANHL